MIRATLTATAIALGTLATPALAEELIESTIAIGNIISTDPLLTINYAQSQDDTAEYALAITAPDAIKSANGLVQSTAVLANCKSRKYSASFGYRPDKSFEETAALMVIFFCSFHKQSFSHSLW